MAGDWIPMRTDLWDCPQVVRILSAFCPQQSGQMSATCPQPVRNLSDRVRKKSEIIGALYRTWSLFDTHSDDGKLQGYDQHALDELVGIDGWSENLQHVGWLLINADSLEMPGFSQYLTVSAKRRQQDARRKSQERLLARYSCPQSVRKSSDKKRTTEQNRTEQNNEETPIPPSAEAKGDFVDSENVDSVESYYRKHHPRWKGSARLRRLIRDRLKDGYTVDDLQLAIDGNHASPFHSGQNDSKQKYHSLGLILSAKKIAGFIEMAVDKRQTTSTKQVNESRERRERIATAWIRRRRTEGAGEEQIRIELRERGLNWPGET